YKWSIGGCTEHQRRLLQIGANGLGGASDPRRQAFDSHRNRTREPALSPYQYRVLLISTLTQAEAIRSGIVRGQDEESKIGLLRRYPQPVIAPWSRFAVRIPTGNHNLILAIVRHNETIGRGIVSAREEFERMQGFRIVVQFSDHLLCGRIPDEEVEICR